MTGAALQLVHVRESAPLVQCITNYVAMNTAANVLLAAGASPAMVHAAEESGEFAAMADALTVNIGTLSPAWLDGMKCAIDGATKAGRPWVLDPVAHFATPFRRQAVAELLALKPTIVRGNASEILALADGQGAGRGVDSGDPVERAEDAARRLATRWEVVVAVTGTVDFVTDGVRAARVAGGSALMPQVTALGCSLTCLIGAFVGASPLDPFDATVAALACFAAAGQVAGKISHGPGSFTVNFLDALHALDEDALQTHAGIMAA